jgi:Fe-S cluster assembly protein SufD
MTVTLTKTAAETALAEEFDRIYTRLPGGRAVAAVRRDAMATFRARGLPHRRVEEWKYSDLRAAQKEALPLAVIDDTNVATKDLNAALGPLAALDAHRLVFVNGHYRAELSKIEPQAGCDIRPLSQALKGLNDEIATLILKPVGPETESVTALNAALATDGAVFNLSGKLDKPILVVHAQAGSTPRHVVTRSMIALLPDGAATVIEAFVTLPGAISGQTNAAMEVAVADRASLTHVQVAIGAGQHVTSCAPTIAADATYRAFHYTAGSAFVRNQAFPLFAGEGGKLDVSGVMLCRGKEHCDTTLVIDHAVPGCESRELFKTVLDDRARSVFQGKVIVRPDAQKTDGKQMSQALMLSEDAEFDSKPELEIYADDVVCGHGATCTEIDADMMFYLQARGIPPDQARALLIQSFIGEAIEKVEHEALRDALSEMALTWLKG